MTTPRTALLALLLAALPAVGRAADVPLPPPPAGTTLAPAAPSPASVPGRYTLALQAGFLAQGGIGSPALQVDVGRHWRTLKGIQLELHLPVRVARPHWEGSLTRTYSDPFLGTYEEDVGTTEDTQWIFEATPSVRAGLPVAQGLAVHLQLGVGLAVTAEEHYEDEQFIGRTTDTQLVLAPTLQAALGLTWKLGDRLDLVFQPLILGARAKAYGATLSALWGLSYRL